MANYHRAGIEQVENIAQEVINLKITLEPAYPPGTTAEEQCEKLREEFKEIINADDWRELAAEYIDLAQVAVGYYEIVHSKIGYYEKKWPADVKRLFSITDRLQDELYDIAGSVFYETVRKDLPYNIKQLIDVCICCFLRTIQKHDRGSMKIRKELMEQFVDQHQQKLTRRRKEWSECSAQVAEKKST